jgi:hypothetical protein
MRCGLTCFVSIVLVLYSAGSARATGLGYQTTQSIGVFPSTAPQPIKFDVHHIPPDPISPVLLHELVVEVVDVHFYPPDDIKPELLPVALLGSDNSREDDMGNLIPGPMGMIDIGLTAPPDDGFPAELFFDFLISANIGGTPANIINADLNPDSGSFFDVFFEVEVNSLAVHTARFMVPDIELLIFVTPVVVANESGIHVQGTILRTGGVPTQSLLSIEFQGHFVPEPGTCSLIFSGFVALALRRRRPFLSGVA